MLYYIENIKNLVDELDFNDMKSIKTIIDISSGLALIYTKLSGLNKRKNKNGYLYIGFDGIHGYKLGATNDLELRQSVLRCGNPSFKVLYYKSSNNIFEEEKILHKTYSTYKYCNEWFSFPKSMMQEFADIGFKRIGGIA
jgi:hypothetical protein